MGLYSWECPVCGVSIKNPYDHPPMELNQCTLLLPNGQTIEGSYDGYGAILNDDGEWDIMVLMYLKGNIKKYKKLRKDEEKHEEIRLKYIKMIWSGEGNPKNSQFIKLFHSKCYEDNDYFGWESSEDAKDQGFYSQT